MKVSVTFGAKQLGRIYSVCCGVQPLFTTHSSYQITHCTNLEYFEWHRILIRKNVIATKIKKTAELVFYQDLSHFPMEITTLGFTCTMCA